MLRNEKLVVGRLCKESSIDDWRAAGTQEHNGRKTCFDNSYFSMIVFPLNNSDFAKKSTCDMEVVPFLNVKRKSSNFCKRLSHGI